MKTKEINGSLFLIDEDAEINTNNYVYIEKSNNIRKVNINDTKEPEKWIVVGESNAILRSSCVKIKAQQFIEGKTDYIVDTLFEVCKDEIGNWFANKTYLEQHSLSDKYFESRNQSLLTFEQVSEMYFKELNQQPEREVEFVMDEKWICDSIICGSHCKPNGIGCKNVKCKQYLSTKPKTHTKEINGKEYKCFTIKCK